MSQLSSSLPNVQGTYSLKKANTRQQLRATQALPRSFSTSKLGRHRNSSRYNVPMRAALDPSALGELVGSDQVLAPVMGALDPAFGALVGIVREVAVNAQLGFAESVDTSTLLQLQEALRTLSERYSTDPTAVAAVGGTAMGATATALNTPNGAQLPRKYDIPAIRAYWKTRPLAANKRSSRLIAKLTSWGGKLILDVQTGAVDKNAPARAKELRKIIVDQGPAFVKVGQAVAIRPDLLPPAYLAELQTLLDQVEPFPSEEARSLLESELGKPLGEVFRDVTAFDKSVAAASIGQVYKATLLDGTEVAVKCQRPNILENVTLDLLTLRDFTDFFCNLPGKSDAIKQIRQNAQGFLAVLDVASERFLEELDYVQEADNGARFEEEMGKVEVVRGVIKVPRVFREVSTTNVLVQEWVDGTKLTELKEDTSEAGMKLKGEVVRKLLNSYMVQFLETGFLHADPHPGNFMVMPDGRLCIMDYGMMTEISYEQRVAFVEYLAHLSSGQWDKTLDDLVNLGFVPAELGEDPAKRAIVAPVLAETLEALYSTGGGMDVKVDALQEQANSRVGEIKDKLDELSKEYPIQLPPYFVLILRAFGTLEGLGLSTDSNFAIVDECFPYIARRMLCDDSPRMRASLRTFVYGSGDRLDVKKVEELAQGFGSFTNSMSAADTASTTALTKTVTAPAQRATMDAASRDLLALLFAKEGNYVQDLLVDEAVRAVDALSRNATVQIWRALAMSAPAAVAASLLPSPFLAPIGLVPGLNTFPILSIFASTRIDSIQLSVEDKNNLAVIQSISALLSRSATTSVASPLVSSSGDLVLPSNIQQFSRQDVDEGLRVAQAVMPGAQRMAQKFSMLMLERFQERIQEDAKSLGIPLR